MKTQYAEISHTYAESQDRRLLRTGITDPSLYERVGDLSGLDVLDLACGDGRLSRQFKLRGAKKVLGIDAESQMISMAQARETQDKLGIEYRVGRVGELGKVGEFDLVVPGFLLHYSKTKGELLRMCQDVYVNLRSGGRMVGINQNPDCPRNPFSKYGSSVHSERWPAQEGDIITVKLYDEGKETISFTNTHWEKSTYEAALKLAGFKDIQWVPMHASEEAVRQRGKEFWQDWLSQPSLIVLEARK